MIPEYVEGVLLAADAVLASLLADAMDDKMEEVLVPPLNDKSDEAVDIKVDSSAAVERLLVEEEDEDTMVNEAEVRNDVGNDDALEELVDVLTDDREDVD